MWYKVHAKVQHPTAPIRVVSIGPKKFAKIGKNKSWNTSMPKPVQQTNKPPGSQNTSEESQNRLMIMI